MHRIFACFLVAALLPWYASLAQEDAPAPAEAAPDLPAMVEAALKKQVDAELEPLVKGFCQKNNLEYPLKAPDMSLTEVQQLVARAVETEIGADAEARRRAKYEEEAKKLYGLAKQYEEVSVETVNGQQFKGLLYDNNEYYIRVSTFRVSKRDLTEESLARFDAEKSKEVQERYVRRRLQKEKLTLENEREEAKTKWSSKLYPEHGYFLHREKWVPALDMVEQALAQRRQQLNAKYRPEVEKKVYISHGYININGQWRLLDEVARERREADAARIAAAKEEASRPKPPPKPRPEPKPEPAPAPDMPPDMPPPDMPPPDMPPPDMPPDMPPEAPPPPEPTPQQPPDDTIGQIPGMPEITPDMPPEEVARKLAEAMQAQLEAQGDGEAFQLPPELQAQMEADMQKGLARVKLIGSIVARVVLWLAGMIFATLFLWIAGKFAELRPRFWACLLAGVVGQIPNAIQIDNIWLLLLGAVAAMVITFPPIAHFSEKKNWGTAVWLSVTLQAVIWIFATVIRNMALIPLHLA